jgi:bifunctional DNA-binding transcriptional regulator/antitoxin component of YhaV-PrlF toxin-antitoxin module
MPETSYKNGKIKLPKEMRERLNLQEGDRIVFYWSSARERYVMVACNLDAATALKGLKPLKPLWTPEETDALLAWHRGRKLSKSELEAVMRVLKAEAEQAGNDPASDPTDAALASDTSEEAQP